MYFQGARAIVRSDLWNPSNYPDLSSLPTPGEILAAVSHNRLGGDEYDRNWCTRAHHTLW